MSTPVVRHLLVCGRVEYDPQAPLAPYTLRNLLFRHRVPDESSFPASLPELWVFARLEGIGDEEFWIEVVWVPGPTDPASPNGDVLVAAYGPFVVRFGPVRKRLSRGWKILGVPFPEGGWYEFRMLSAGRILARELVYLED